MQPVAEVAVRFSSVGLVIIGLFVIAWAYCRRRR